MPLILTSCSQKQVSKEAFLDAVSKIEKHQYKEALVSCSGTNNEKLNFQYYYNESLQTWTSKEDKIDAFTFLLVPLTDYVETLIGSSNEDPNGITFYINPFAIESITPASYVKMTYNKFGYVEKYLLERTNVEQGESPSLDINISYK